MASGARVSILNKSLPYRPGGKKQLKSQDVTAKLVGFNILYMVPKIMVFCIANVLGTENPERGK